MGDLVIKGLENDLKQLAHEAGRGLSEVKDAANIAAKRLESNRSRYIRLAEQTILGQAQNEQNNGTEKLDDVIQPFVLACNHTNASARVIVISLGAIQRLLQADVLGSDERMRIMHVLVMQYQRPKPQRDIQLKIIQTLPMLVVSDVYSVNPNLLFEALQLSCKCIGSDPGLGSAAISQIITGLFEKIDRGLAITMTLKQSNDIQTGSLLFKALCQRINDGGIANSLGSSGNLLRGYEGAGSQNPLHDLSRNIALELLDSIMSDYPDIFLDETTRDVFGSLVSSQVIPKVSKSLVGRSDWKLMVRMLRTVVTLLCKLRPLLALEQIEKLVGVLLKMFDDGQGTCAGDQPRYVSPLWLRVLILETLNIICSDQELIETLQQLRYGDASFFARIVKALGDSVNQYIHMSPQIAKGIDEIAARPSRGLDLLNVDEPPVNLNESMVTLLAAECLASIADCLALSQGFTLSGTAAVVQIGKVNTRAQSPSIATKYSSSQLSRFIEDDSETSTRAMMVECWKPMLEALESLLIRCHNENIVQFLLKAYMSMTNSCGIVGLGEPRNAFIMSLCKFSLPHWHSSAAAMPVHHHTEHLTPKHIQALKALFNIAHGLGGILGGAWHILLETFEQLDHIMYCTAIEKKLASTNSSGNLPGINQETYRKKEKTNASQWHLVDDEMSIVESMLRFLFNSTKYFDDDALVHIITALTQLSFTALAHMETMHFSGAESPRYLAPLPTKQEGWISSLTNTLAEAATATIHAVSNEDRYSSDEEGDGLNIKLNLDHVAQASRSATPPPSSSSPTKKLHRLDTSNPVKSLDSFVARATYRNPPFSIEKLVETAKLNIFRITIIWDMVQNMLTTIAAKSDPTLRMFGVKSLEDIVVDSMLFEESGGRSPSMGEKKSSFPMIPEGFVPEPPPRARRMSAQIPRLDVKTFQKELLTGYMQLARSGHVDAREATIQSLLRIIASCGHILDAGWDVIIEELSVSTGRMRDASFQYVDSVRKDYATKDAISLIPSSFKIVQLIVDDFFPSLDVKRRMDMVTCIRAYANQTDHVNISLQAVNMLWTLSDFTQQQSPPVSASTDMETLEASNKLLLFIFRSLSQLSVDDRPEVRNCALRTLCSLIVACARKLTFESWRYCCSQILFPLLRDVNSIALNASQEQIHGQVLNQASGERAVIHHSLDTLQKQWRETVIIGLQGASRVTRAAVQCSRSADWTLSSWNKVVEHLVSFLCNNHDEHKSSISALRAMHSLSLLVLVDDGNCKRQYADEELDAFYVIVREAYESLAHKNGNQLCGFQFVEVATEFINSAGEVYEQSHVPILREPEELNKLMHVVSTLLRTFPTKAKHMAPIERATMKLFSAVGSVPSESWFTIYNTIVSMVSKSHGPEQFVSPAFTTNIESQFVEHFDASTRKEDRVLLVDGILVAFLNRQSERGDAPSEYLCMSFLHVVIQGLKTLEVASEDDETTNRIWATFLQVFEILANEKELDGDRQIMVTKLLDEIRIWVVADQVPTEAKAGLANFLDPERSSTQPNLAMKPGNIQTANDVAVICSKNISMLSKLPEAADDCFSCISAVVPTLVRDLKTLETVYMTSNVNRSQLEDDVSQVLDALLLLNLPYLPDELKSSLSGEALVLFGEKSHLLLVLECVCSFARAESTKIRFAAMKILDLVSQVLGPKSV